MNKDDAIQKETGTAISYAAVPVFLREIIDSGSS